MVGGLAVLSHAAKKSVPWEGWETDRLRKVGSGEGENARMASLGKFFETEVGIRIKERGERVAILGRRGLPPHEKNFSFPIFVNWFLMPERKELDLILEAEAAVGYDWVFAFQNYGRKLDEAGRVKPEGSSTGFRAEEVWAEEMVWVYWVGDPRREDTRHKTSGEEVGR